MVWLRVTCSHLCYNCDKPSFPQPSFIFSLCFSLWLSLHSFRKEPESINFSIIRTFQSWEMLTVTKCFHKRYINASLLWNANASIIIYFYKSVYKHRHTHSFLIWNKADMRSARVFLHLLRSFNVMPVCSGRMSVTQPQFRIVLF